MRHLELVVVVLCLCACAPTRGVYLGSDVHSDSGAPSDSSTAHEDAEVIDVGVAAMRDAELPVVPSDAGRPSRSDAMAMPTSEPPSCAGGTGDCDEDAGNGCEVDLMQDAKHCGRCDLACSSADCSCQGGKIVTVCPSGRADCDGNPANGCEVNIETSMQDCGSCGRLCHTNGHDAITAVCTSGQCRLTCQSELFPELDCDGNPDNGCETSIWTDNQNCGACGVRCTCIDGICS
jgi:hypothetical protein